MKGASLSARDSCASKKQNQFVQTWERMDGLSVKAGHCSGDWGQASVSETGKTKGMRRNSAHTSLACERTNMG